MSMISCGSIQFLHIPRAYPQGFTVPMCSNKQKTTPVSAEAKIPTLGAGSVQNSGAS